MRISQYIDLKEPFTYRVIKPRSNDRKNTPEWALNDKKVQQVVLTVFPKPDIKQRHRNGAARWIRIIYLYWRMGKTEGQVAEEMQDNWPDITPKAVNRTIARIRKVAEGLNSRGLPRRQWGGRRPGAGRLRSNP
jgi:hypothetical protein